MCSISSLLVLVFWSLDKNCIGREPQYPPVDGPANIPVDLIYD